jgi:hypothetical protein
VRLRTLVVFLSVTGLLQLGCASRAAPVSAGVIGATAKPSLESRTATSRDPFKKLREALDSATRTSPKSRRATPNSAREAGLIGRDDPGAVATSGRDRADGAVPSDAGASVPEKEAGATKQDETPAAQSTVTSDRSVLRLAGIALVIVGLVLGLFAYAYRRRGI